MKLTNPTDDVLDERFAIDVAGWKRTKTKEAGDPIWDTGTDCVNQGSGFAYRVPRYTKSADLVLPWLEKPFKDNRNWSVAIFRSVVDFAWRVTIREGLKYSVETPEHTGLSTGLPRAAVIALLRAHGIEVEFS